MNFMTLLASFGGGVFGAALGGLPIFVFTGLAVLLGAAAILGGSSFDFISNVAFGPVFGPHVAFCGGVAAVAYAAKRGTHGEGKDIVSGGAGFRDPAALLVGGLFGILGYLLVSVFNSIFPAGLTDNVALTVFLSNSIVRLVFGKTGLLGTLSEEARNRGRFTPGGNDVWAPQQQDFGQLFVISLGISLVISWFAVTVLNVDQTYLPVANLTGFGISAASLAFLCFGINVPVTHHMTLIAAIAATASGNVVIGAVMGVISAFVGELASRTFYIHGDTHIDPPATAIFIMTFMVYVLF